MLTIWIIPFPVMVFSDFPVLVNEKSNLQIRIGYFAFLPSLDISGNPTKKQGKPKLNPTWIFDFFSSGGKFFDLYMCRHPRALKSLAKITDTKPHKTGFFPQTRSLWPAVKCLSLLSGGGKGYFFSVVLGLQSRELKNHDDGLVDDDRK